MTQQNDGGPAFPSTVDGVNHPGMSLRDWLAGQALTGLLSDTMGLMASTQVARKDKIRPSQQVAIEAWGMADTMLETTEHDR